MLKYKGKDIVAPPNNTKYIPVKVYSGVQESNMAITDIQVVGDTPYCKIGDNAYLWKIKQALKLTDSHYKMYEIYPDTYSSMTEIPDELDTSELTTTNKMFWKSEVDWATVESQEEYDAAINASKNSNNSLIVAPQMDTSNVTDMSYMFGDWYDVNWLEDPTDPDTSPIIFKNPYCDGCHNLTTVPQYDTSKVTNFKCMFAGCTSLPKVFPWTIRIPDDCYAVEDANLDKMFIGSSVEEVVFKAEHPFDDIDNWMETFKERPQSFLDMLDPNGTLKKVTIYIRNPDFVYCVVDKEGYHSYQPHTSGYDDGI